MASVVILTLNGLKYTRLCVDSLFRNTAVFELIIVDQGSTDGTIDYLLKLQRRHAGVKIITNDRNVGFAAGCNQAAKSAIGNVLVFLNNDVIVTPGWLQGLIKPLYEDCQLAGSGPVSNATGDLQLDPNSLARIRKIPQDIYSYARQKKRMMKGKIWYFHRLSGFCLAMKADVFAEMGGFDERLTFYQDDALCFKIIRKGQKLAIVPSVFVYHFGSRTFKDEGMNIPVLMYVNRTRFLAYYLGRERIGARPDSPKVSIIVTTFNRPVELEQAIQSIRAQTYSNWEAIIVNDGGRNVRRIVEAAQDKRLKYFNSKHFGRPTALNLALGRVSESKYVAYLDDDDIWYPEHLDYSIGFLERNPMIGVVYSKAVKRNFEKKAHGTRDIVNEHIEHAMEFDLKRLLGYNWIPNLSVVHRSDLLQQIGQFADLPILEGYHFLLRLASVGEFAHLPIVTGEYYVDLSGSGRDERFHKTNPELYFEIRDRIISEFRRMQTPVQTSEGMRIEAQRFLDQGESKRSLGLLRTALRLNPFNYLALVDYLGACMDVNKSGLNARLQHFLSERPDKSVIWKVRAQELMRRHDYTSALRALEMGLVTVENEAEISILYSLISLCYSKLRAKDTSLACLSKLRLPSKTTPLGLPALTEGATLDQWFDHGIFATALKAMSYYYLYSKRWGRWSATRKILRYFRTRKLEGPLPGTEEISYSERLLWRR